jgi:hypothetical protein
MLKARNLMFINSPSGLFFYASVNLKGGKDD